MPHIKCSFLRVMPHCNAAHVDYKQNLSIRIVSHMIHVVHKWATDNATCHFVIGSIISTPHLFSIFY